MTTVGSGADKVPCFRIEVGPLRESREAMSAFKRAVAEDLNDGSDASRDVRVSLVAA